MSTLRLRPIYLMLVASFAVVAGCAGIYTHPETRAFGAEYYPPAAWRLGQEGRVLVEFRVNANLMPIDAMIRHADPSFWLNAGAQRVAQVGIFDRPSHIKPKSGATYRATIIFCLQPGNCRQIVPFPHTMPIIVKRERYLGLPNPVS
jgi:hypothetical protein